MPTMTAASIDQIVAKFKGALDFQDQRMIERRKALFTFQIALVCRGHLVLHGSPGNAKTMTIDGICRHFPDLRLNKTQAFKASTPEQFLGPISFKAMEDDRYERITRNKFPDSEVYVCDELPRAPKPVMTSFQGGMVEREFDNGSGPQPIPLMSFIGTSNHLPDDEELQAFFDRFLFKLVIKAPQAHEAIVSLLRQGIERRANPTINDVPPELLITRDELVTVQEFADTQVTVSDDFLGMLAEIYSNLVGAGINPSLRRVNDLTQAFQALAALEGRTEVIQDDILIAADSLWTAESEIETVYAEVVRFASEWQRDAAKLLDAHDETRDKLTKIQAQVAKLGPGQPIPRDVTNEGIDIVNENVELKKLVEKQVKEAAGRDTSALQQILDDIDTGAKWVEDRLLGGLSLR